MGRPVQIQMDCADPESLAVFWAEVLDYSVPTPIGHASWQDYSRAEAREPGEAWCRVVDPEGKGVSILFHRVPEPKTVKNRLHLDVWVAPRGREPDVSWPIVDAEVQRLLGLGASEIRRPDDDQVFVVMSDPEGNEFCVCG